MAALTTQNVTRAGITPTFAAVAASDTFTPSNFVWVEVKNAGGSPDTVTISVLSGDPSPTLVIADLSISVIATTGDKIIGPFPAQFFADPTTGAATIAHSFTTSVTCGVFNLTQS